MFELLRLNLGIGVTKEDETSVHDFFSKASIKRDCERRLAKYANEPNYKYRIDVKKLKQNIWQASATLLSHLRVAEACHMFCLSFFTSMRYL